jgi:hypothetical protein
VSLTQTIAADIPRSMVPRTLNHQPDPRFYNTSAFGELRPITEQDEYPIQSMQTRPTTPLLCINVNDLNDHTPMRVLFVDFSEGFFFEKFLGTFQLLKFMNYLHVKMLLYLNNFFI